MKKRYCTPLSEVVNIDMEKGLLSASNFVDIDTSPEGGVVNPAGIWGIRLDEEKL